MAAYYPLLDDVNQGPPGIPGIGFKLTNDGNYDMEKKILRNLSDPLEISDSATKAYTDHIKEDLKSEVVALSNVSLLENSNGDFDARNKNILNIADPVNPSDCASMKYVREVINDLRDRSLIQSGVGPFDAKGKTIGNLDDPKTEMNAVNKRFFERKALVLKKDGFDAKNKTIKNVKEPVNDNDALTKDYFVKNALTVKNGVFDARHMKIINVGKISSLSSSTEVVTKAFLDSQEYYATVLENQPFETSPGVYKQVKFELRSSDLLDKNLAFSESMDYEVTVRVIPLTHPWPTVSIRLDINDAPEVELDLDTGHLQSMTYYVRGDKNSIVKVFIKCKAQIQLKPVLYVKRIYYQLFPL